MLSTHVSVRTQVVLIVRKTVIPTC